MSIPKSAIEAATKAIADEVGHGMREKCFDHARAALLAALPYIRDQVLEEESRIDALRLQAFKTNSDADRQSYFDAVSKWFQGRHDRTLKSHQKKGGDA